MCTLFAQKALMACQDVFIKTLSYYRGSLQNVLNTSQSYYSATSSRRLIYAGVGTHGHKYLKFKLFIFMKKSHMDDFQKFTTSRTSQLHMSFSERIVSPGQQFSE